MCKRHLIIFKTYSWFFKPGLFLNMTQTRAAFIVKCETSWASQLKPGTERAHTPPRPWSFAVELSTTPQSPETETKRNIQKTGSVSRPVFAQTKWRLRAPLSRHGNGWESEPPEKGLGHLWLLWWFSEVFLSESAMVFFGTALPKRKCPGRPWEGHFVHHLIDWNSLRMKKIGKEKRRKRAQREQRPRDRKKIDCQIKHQEETREALYFPFLITLVNMRWSITPSGAFLSPLSINMKWRWRVPNTALKGDRRLLVSESLGPWWWINDVKTSCSVVKPTLMMVIKLWELVWLNPALSCCKQSSHWSAIFYF